MGCHCKRLADLLKRTCWAEHSMYCADTVAATLFLLLQLVEGLKERYSYCAADYTQELLDMAADYDTAGEVP